MSRQLPARPNLEYLKNQAKELLPELRLRHPDAKLADAQHMVAREYGFLNWAALKTHVDAAVAGAVAEVTVNPFAGTWIANVGKSRRHPANPFQRATIEFAIEGDVVTMTDVFIDESGREERGVNTLHVDGAERPVEHGYAMTAAWRGSQTLEVVVKKAANVVGRATYALSSDGQTLTTSDMSGEQVIVLERAHEASPEM